MNVLKKIIKKSLFTLILLFVSVSTFSADCFPGDLLCETDDPLDTHILILMLFVAIFAIYSLNKKENRLIIK